MTRVNHVNVSRWLLVVFVLWFGSYAYMYLFGLGGPKPLYSYFFLLGVALFYAAVKGGQGRPFLDSTDRWLRYFLCWLVIYFMYGMFGFLESSQDAVAIQALTSLGEAVLVAVAFTTLMAESQRIRLACSAFAALALLATILDVWDFTNPTFSAVPGRAAGLYLNPTIAGNFIALAMVGGIGSIPRRFRLPYLLACGTGIVVTFSRESWIVWGVAAIWLGWLGYFGKIRRRKRMAIIATIVGGGFTLLLFSGRVGSVVAGSQLETYLTPNTAARLGIGASVLSGHAAAVRENLIPYSLDLASRAPWLGHGIGYTDEWRYPVGPHDMYLLFFVDGGIVGLLIYLVLTYLLVRAGTGLSRIVALQIVILGFFSHNNLDQPAVVMMIAFVFAHGVTTRAVGGIKSENRQFMYS